ncbi:MAG: formylglycine-generating enzyme family protein [Polyangiaceae bacterium]|nr:formylglycine-generating enzyme family protein [Polyangiaceae bacterium]
MREAKNSFVATASIVAVVTLAALAVAGCEREVSSPLGGLTQSRYPARIASFELGLGRVGNYAPASGIVALRPVAEGRVRLPGGHFMMGSTTRDMRAATEMCMREALGSECEDNTSPSSPAPIIRAEGHTHEVTLSPYEIDRTEVTVRAYKRCVSAGGCAPAAFSVGDARYDMPDFPITHVRWEDAVAYCAWASGRLPTEAEWEFAASGPAGRVLPWGNVENSRLANHGAFAVDPTDGSDGFVGLAPVGSFPDGATSTGLYDMAGNVAEWVFDLYARDADGFGYSRAAEVDPAGPAFGGEGHVVRGGSYRDGMFMLRTAARSASVIATREIGFRCAYSVTAKYSRY